VTVLFSSLLLGLAWFAAIAIAIVPLAWGAGRLALRHPRASAATLLGARLFAGAVPALFVLTMFMPSHWRFEPARADETFGLVLGGLAVAGVWLIGRALVRAARLIWQDYQLGRATGRLASPITQGAYEVRGLAGVALAGILRPRVIIGSDALAALTSSELAVAISHEEAHRRSRDNLKRFLIACAPDLFGWTQTARDLEARWQAESECQADALAVRGEDGRAIVLASALVKVARLAQRPVSVRPSEAWSAFHVPNLLETRVRRLVSAPMTPAAMGRAWAFAALLAAGAAAVVGLSDLGYALHEVTESFVANLP
jgi:Zn-dependent protease with chaperone function